MMALSHRLADSEKNVRSSFAREELRFSIFDFGWPLAFMLCTAMCGYKLYFAWLFVFAILINRFQYNKYDFVIMLTILGSAMQLIDTIDTYFPFSNVVFMICVGILIFFRKRGIMVKLCWSIAAYFIALVWLAHYSLESLPRQLMGVMSYCSVIAFIIPLAVFSGREFDIRYFFHRCLVYAFLFAGFFTFDIVIMNGCFLLPRDNSWIFYEMATDIENININPLSFDFPRRWPQGLYMYILCLYPLARFYKMSIGKWIWFLLPLGLSRTFTFMVALILVYMCCLGHLKKLIKYFALGVVAIVGLYFIDAQLDEYEGNSTLRIKSSIDQVLLLDLDKADEEDLAELGSTRGAQIIPKMEHLFSLGRQWVGLGFISRNSTIQSYVIENDLYSNPDDAEEVATGVESMPFQVILTIGFIGLVIVMAFYIGIWMIIRKLPFAGYFNSVMWCLFIMGISGLGGWISPYTLYLLALSLGVVILNARTITGDFAPLVPYSPTSIR